MQTNCKYNINDIIPKNWEREIWKMDTSHFHILSTIINDTNKGKLKLIENEKKFKFEEPVVINGQKDFFAKNTCGQYLRILVFYGVIDYNILLENNINNWDSFRSYCVNNEIIITTEIDFEEYLKNNISKIAKNIMNIISLDNFISKDALKILSTAEFFLNYKDHAVELNLKEIVGYFYNYELKIKQAKINSDINSIFGEYLLYIKTFSYFDALFEELGCYERVDKISEEIEEFELDFEGIGYLGELIVDRFLKEKYTKVDWVSRRNKRSNHDFKADDDYIEVKTTTNNRKIISFNLSWNEYILQQNNKYNYFVYYVDGIYKLDNPVKEIVNNINNIIDFVEKNEINIERIDNSLLSKFQFVQKGFWVKENK